MVKDFRDIQSIRAIAVLLVVGYHLNSELFKFGYLGVDIFFVISGFIITHLILKNQSFHIINFYQKRIARIFPAMALVTLTTVVLGSIFLRTDDLLNLTYQGILSLLGVGNIYFATTQIGYFEIESFRQPLLHLWSLSTEIQFYLVAPIFILLFKKINTYVKQIFISVIFILSIALYIDFISLPGIDNYYLLTSRIWEFVIGSYIATLNNRKKIDYFSGKLATVISLLSLMSLNLFQVNFLGTSIIEIIIVLLSAVVILQAVSNGNSGKSLSPNLTVFIGDLSYSIYLWHWPIIFFLKNLTNVTRNELSLITLTLTFILSFLSFKYWENRFRGNISKRLKSLLSIFIILTFIISLTFSNRNFSEYRFTGLKKELSNFEIKSGFSKKETACLSDYGQTYEVWDDECLIRKKDSVKNTTLIWGDSHVAAIADAIESDGRNKNIGLSRALTTACPPIKSMNSKLSPNSKCKTNNKFVWDYIISEKPKTLILVARWYIYANYEWYESGLRSLQVTIDEAKNAGVKNIILIGASPEWGDSLPDLLWKKQLTISNFPYELENTRVSNLRDINYNLREMSSAASIKYIDPIDIWCKENICLTYQNKVNFYTIQIDGDHLSVNAAKEIVKLFN